MCPSASTGFCLKRATSSVEELLGPWLPRSRRHFKRISDHELNCRPYLPKAQATAAHTVSTSQWHGHECLVASRPLLLWTIEVTLDRTITVMGIIDSTVKSLLFTGCMGKTQYTNEAQAIMFMSLPMDRQPRLWVRFLVSGFSVGEVSLYCSVQSVRKFPLQMSQSTFHVPALPSAGVPGW